MRISIFGLGYVGCVSAACLAHDGFTVTGVEVNPWKVDLFNSGCSPVLEPGVENFMEEPIRSGRLQACAAAQEAVTSSDVSLICVGTPSNGNGSLHLQYLENVCREVGMALACTEKYHVVTVRSTVLPGTVEERLIPLLEQVSGRRCGEDFGVAMNPEFLREGSAVHDYYHPSQVIIGAIDQRSGDVVQRLYKNVHAPVVRTTIATAEMVKYVSNAFHALKITFANEIGNLCLSHGIDGHEVMEIFCQDRQLNISSAYLKPGFAFGGSCLPKDLRALLYRAKERDLDCPVLKAVLHSNQLQLQRGIELVEKTGLRNVGILGLSFKAGTDDVRESPTVPLVETLLGRGYQVKVYDEQVAPHRLIGANKAFLERELPHIASIMRASLREVLDDSEVVVVANASPAFSHVAALLRDDQVLIDLVGVVKRKDKVGRTYASILP